MRVKVTLSVLAVISIIACSLVAFTGSVSADTGVATTVSTYSIPSSPPAGFVPLTASDADLAKYGLPVRPTDPVALKQWTTMMSAAKTYVKPTLVPCTGDLKLGTSNQNHYTWCGYADSPYSNYGSGGYPYTYPGSGNSNSGTIYSDFYVPSVMVSNGGIAALWSGWSDGSQVDQAGVCIGTAIPSQGGSGNIEFFMENYPVSPVWVKSYTIHSGDMIYLSLTAQNQRTTTITWVDGTGGFYTSATLTMTYIPSAYSQVDFIYESYHGLQYPTSVGTVTFTMCEFKYVRGSSAYWGFYNSWNNIKYTMVGYNGYTYAYVLGPYSNGFQVKTQHP